MSVWMVVADWLHLTALVVAVVLLHWGLGLVVRDEWRNYRARVAQRKWWDE